MVYHSCFSPSVPLGSRYGPLIDCRCGTWHEGDTYRMPVCEEGHTGRGAVGAGVAGMQEERDRGERGSDGDECWPREECLCGREEVE